MRTNVFKRDTGAEMLPYKGRRFKTEKLIFTIFLASICSNLFAFFHNVEKDGWKLDQTVNNVDCYYKMAKCNGTNVVFLKFENRNKGDVKISWKEVFTTQFENGKEGAQGIRELTLSRGVTLPTGCTDVVNKLNIVLPSQISSTYVADIQKFEFKDVSVTQIK